MVPYVKAAALFPAPSSPSSERVEDREQQTGVLVQVTHVRQVAARVHGVAHDGVEHRGGVFPGLEE